MLYPFLFPLEIMLDNHTNCLFNMGFRLRIQVASRYARRVKRP